MKNKYFWLLFPFLEPLLFKDYLEWVDLFFTCGKLIALLIIIIEYFSRYKLSKYLLVVFLYEIWLLIATILNPDGSIVRYCGPTVSVIGVCMYIELIIKRGLIVEVLHILTNTLSVFCIINAITVFLYPQGLTNQGDENYIYFLGLENRFSFYYLPLVAFSGLYSYLKYGKVKLFVYIMSLFNMLILIDKWAVGGMLGMIFMNMLLLFRKSLFSYKIFNSVVCFVIVIIANILLVFLRVQYLFEDFIVNDLGKDITLTGRTLLWDYGLLSFLYRPIWGIGYQDLGSLPVEMLNVGHMHNLFMNVLFYGGLGGMVLFLIIQFNWVKSLMNYRRYFEASILNLCLFAAFIMSLGDTFDSAPYWILVSMSVYINRIVKNV